jgi:protein TonB
MSAHRLLFALVASFCLHATLLAWSVFHYRPRSAPVVPPAVIEAQLRPSEAQAIVPPPALLKNTLDDIKARRPRAPADEPPVISRQPRTAPVHARLDQRARQRKLAEHLFYPPEAVARGLEGEVRLLLTLDAHGTVLSAEVAASSGYAILDQAAVSAAYAMARVDNGGAREMILPVQFRLRSRP